VGASGYVGNSLTSLVTRYKDIRDDLGRLYLYHLPIDHHTVRSLRFQM
jgi:hypothetical protein